MCLPGLGFGSSYIYSTWKLQKGSIAMEKYFNIWSAMYKIHL